MKGKLHMIRDTVKNMGVSEILIAYNKLDELMK